LFENKRVVFLGDAKKYKITQKSAQGHEKKVDKGSGIEAREQMIADMKRDPRTPQRCMNIKRKDLQNLQFVID